MLYPTRVTKAIQIYGRVGVPGFSGPGATFSNDLIAMLSPAETGTPNFLWIWLSLRDLMVRVWRMITALLLIFDPSNTWEKIGQTLRHSVARVFLSYLLPLVIISNAVEAFGMLTLGVEEGGLITRTIKPSQQLLARYEAARVLLDLVIIFGGAWMVQKMGEGFHRKHTYAEAFATLGYSLGPLYVLRLLDAIPAVNTWIPYGIGILLAVAALYRGIPRVMKPDPSNALGLYLMASLTVIVLTGMANFLAMWVLEEKVFAGASIMPVWAIA